MLISASVVRPAAGAFLADRRLSRLASTTQCSCWHRWCGRPQTPSWPIGACKRCRRQWQPKATPTSQQRRRWRPARTPTMWKRPRPSWWRVARRPVSRPHWRRRSGRRQCGATGGRASPVSRGGAPAVSEERDAIDKTKMSEINTREMSEVKGTSHERSHVLGVEEGRTYRESGGNVKSGGNTRTGACHGEDTRFAALSRRSK